MDFSQEELESNWSPESKVTSKIYSIPPSLEPSPSKEQKVWFDEMKALYGESSTENMYQHYNSKFIVWFNENYGADLHIEEKHAR